MFCHTYVSSSYIQNNVFHHLIGYLLRKTLMVWPLFNYVPCRSNHRYCEWFYFCFLFLAICTKKGLNTIDYIEYYFIACWGGLHKSSQIPYINTIRNLWVKAPTIKTKLTPWVWPKSSAIVQLIISHIFELTIKSLKEGWNCGFDTSWRKLFIKSLLADCVLEPIILKVGWNLWDLLFSHLNLWDNFRI